MRRLFPAASGRAGPARDQGDAAAREFAADRQGASRACRGGFAGSGVGLSAPRTLGRQVRAQEGPCPGRLSRTRKAYIADLQRCEILEKPLGDLPRQLAAWWRPSPSGKNCRKSRSPRAMRRALWCSGFSSRRVRKTWKKWLLSEPRSTCRSSAERRLGHRAAPAARLSAADVRGGRGRRGD